AAGMIDGFDRLVLRIHNDDTCVVLGGLLGGRLHEAHDNHAVADFAEPGGGAIDSNYAAAGFARNDVRFKAAAVLCIGDEDRLVGKQAAGAQQVGIDGNAPVIVHIGVSHGDVVEFGFQKLGQHGTVGL